jgi:hypothetical protein
VDLENQRERTGVAKEIPASELPPVTYRDLPEPLPLRKLLGPGIIMVGISMAAGEFILWPYITSVVGLGLLWLAFVTVGAQVFINTEINATRWRRARPLLRGSLATGNRGGSSSA